MKEVGLYEAKTKLSALVQSVHESGKPIALTRHGKVVAELIPPRKNSPQRGCLITKDFRMSKDFDEPELGFEDFFDSEVQSDLKVSESAKKYQRRKKGRK